MHTKKFSIFFKIRVQSRVGTIPSLPEYQLLHLRFMDLDWLEIYITSNGFLPVFRFGRISTSYDFMCHAFTLGYWVMLHT